MGKAPMATVANTKASLKYDLRRGLKSVMVVVAQMFKQKRSESELPNAKLRRSFDQ